MFLALILGLWLLYSVFPHWFAAHWLSAPFWAIIVAVIALSFLHYRFGAAGSHFGMRLFAVIALAILALVGSTIAEVGASSTARESRQRQLQEAATRDRQRRMADLAMTAHGDFSLTTIWSNGPVVVDGNLC